MITVSVRPAVAADAEVVASLYNDGIDGRLATFETRHRTGAEMVERIDGTADPHSFLVAEHAGAVVGWAATSPYSQRPVYAGIAEYSVYVAPAAQSAGVGRALIEALLRTAQEAGLDKVTSRILPENTTSLALAQRLGFRIVGTHVAHARLDGVWRDVITVEALLGGREDRPTTEGSGPQGDPAPRRPAQGAPAL